MASRATSSAVPSQFGSAEAPQRPWIRLALWNPSGAGLFTRNSRRYPAVVRGKAQGWLGTRSLLHQDRTARQRRHILLHPVSAMPATESQASTHPVGAVAMRSSLVTATGRATVLRM